LTDEYLTQTPLSLHPDVLQTLGHDHQEDPVVGLMKDALSTARASWQATLAGHAKVMADPTRTETSNMQRSATAAARRQTEALQRLDGAIERAQREIGFIDQTVATPADPTPPHVVGLVASALRSMTPQQRSEAITDAIQSGDSATVCALFTGPAYAFGLTQTERNMYKHQYLQTAYPAALARRAALEAGIEKVKSAGQSLMLAHAKLFDKKKLDDAAARAKAAEDALS
jgi:hypothetical protein